MKREIEAIRLKTKMSEAFAATRLPYPKQAAIAKMQLNALQESYKQLTGEYAKEFVIIKEEFETDLKILVERTYKQLMDMKDEHSSDDFKIRMNFITNNFSFLSKEHQDDVLDIINSMDDNRDSIKWHKQARQTATTNESELNEIQVGSELVRRKEAERLLTEVVTVLDGRKIGDDWNDLFKKIKTFLAKK